MVPFSSLLAKHRLDRSYSSMGPRLDLASRPWSRQYFETYSDRNVQFFYYMEAYVGRHKVLNELRGTDKEAQHILFPLSTLFIGFLTSSHPVLQKHIFTIQTAHKSQKMQTFVLALALVGTAIAQSSTASAEPTATTMTVVGGKFAGQRIAGQHVGAAQSYQVILSERTGNTLGEAGDQLFFNETSNQLMDESLVADIPLPCYIINDAEMISDNAGPLECGVLADNESRNTINLGDDGSVFFIGVQSWWVCGVNATQPYGVIPGTLVGGFTTSKPTGPGIHNCHAVEGLKLASGSGSQTSLFASTGSSSAAASSSATNPPTNTLTTERLTTMASPTSTSSQAANSASASGATATGGASHNMMHGISTVGAFIAGGLAFLL